MPTYRKKMSIRRRKPKSKSGVVSDSVKKYVKNVTRKAKPEMKYRTESVAIGPSEPVVTTNGATTLGYVWNEFCTIAQGTAINNRIGNEIRLQGFHSKITYFNKGSDPVYIRRLVIGINSGDTEAGTDTAELFQNLGLGVSIATVANTTAALQYPINHVTYKVYFDKTFKLGPVSATDGSNTRLVNYFQKFSGKKVIYENTGSGVLAQNHRFAEVILAVGANNDQATGNVGVEYSRHARTFFTDP